MRGGGLIAGVDAGGTHTTVVVADAAGSPMARVTGGPGAVAPGTVDQAAQVIRETLAEALAELTGRPAALVVGAAGVGRDREREALACALAGAADRIEVTTDAAIALEGAFGEEPGILIIAGTGSIGVARDPGGRTRRSGGLGWQLGDEGSGYALGRAALSAVGKAADGRGPRTALSEHVRRAVGAETLDDLVRWAAGASREEVAGLAELVCQAAAGGDTVAGTLVADAADELGRLAEALRAGFPPGQAVPVALAGRVLAAGSPLRLALRQRLAALGGLTAEEREVDPAAGAVALARRLMMRGAGERA